MHAHVQSTQSYMYFLGFLFDMKQVIRSEQIEGLPGRVSKESKLMLSQLHYHNTFNYYLLVKMEQNGKTRETKKN